MNLGAVEPIALFALVATITPGGATALATASGAQFGFRRTVPLIAGIAAGLASLAAAAAAGLGSLLMSAPSLELLLKLVGSAYLVYLAWKIGRAGRPGTRKGDAAPLGFLAGIGLLWLNPKGWAMTLAAAAAFAALAHGPAQLALMLGSSFCLAAVFSLVLWSSAGMVLARMLQTDGQWRVLNAILGLLLAATLVPIWLV
jgi:threonine/homoserine/homoserine lactone efflux protein